MTGIYATLTVVIAGVFGTDESDGIWETHAVTITKENRIKPKINSRDFIDVIIILLILLLYHLKIINSFPKISGCLANGGILQYPIGIIYITHIKQLIFVYFLGDLFVGEHPVHIIPYRLFGNETVFFNLQPAALL